MALALRLGGARKNSGVSSSIHAILATNRLMRERFPFQLMNQENPEEFIQLIDPEQDEELSPEELAEVLPVLPIKNTVLFPGVVIPITVTRQKSIRLIKKAYSGNRIVGVLTQRNKQEEPKADDLYKLGTIARIIKMLVLPDGNTTIIIQGKNRFRVKAFVTEEPFLTASIEVASEDNFDLKSRETKALFASLKDAARKVIRLNPEIPQEAQMALDNIQNPLFLTHFLSSNLNVEVSDKQKILETRGFSERATLVLQYLSKEIQMLEIKSEINKKVHTDIDQQQRDYFLRQQMKVLQDELGYAGPDKEVERLRELAKKKKWPQAVAAHFQKELEKILRMNPQAAEYPVAMNYAEFLVDLPWNDYTDDNFDLTRAQKILDKDHFGLKKV